MLGSGTRITAHGKTPVGSSRLGTVLLARAGEMRMARADVAVRTPQPVLRGAPRRWWLAWWFLLVLESCASVGANSAVRLMLLHHHRDQRLFCQWRWVG